MVSQYDVIFISDNVSRTYGKLKEHTVKRRDAHLIGTFLNGKTFKVLPIANCPEIVYGLRFKEVEWDTEYVPDLGVMNEVEQRKGR